MIFIRALSLCFLLGFSGCGTQYRLLSAQDYVRAGMSVIPMASAHAEEFSPSLGASIGSSIQPEPRPAN